MSFHGLSSVTIGVPDVGAAESYYAEFGLEPMGGGAFSTVDGGIQLKLVESPRRRLVEVVVAADDRDDLDRIASRLTNMGYDSQRADGALVTREPCSGAAVVVEVKEPIVQSRLAVPSMNAPGSPDRPNCRAPGIKREGPVRPRRLGHVVIGTPDVELGKRFFVDGIGFKISDLVPDTLVFMRCSSDHHNLLVAKAPAPFLHHTSWEVEDIDEIGRGATAMLSADPTRHVWGFGRHYIGSNFFWYLKDPAGNFTEYYADLDCIVDDSLWEPEVVEASKGLYSWGPPPPPSFLEPEDLADLMIGAHRSG